MVDYELVIIGAGPAGMTAAVYAARKFIRTLLISKDIGGQAALSAGIENYMGYQFITGAELVAKFEEQVKQFKVDQEFDVVTSLTRQDGHFVVRTEAGKQYTSHTVIIASGKAPRKLNVPGEEQLIGRGVSYCSTCDGPFFAGMPVAVIGGGDSALQAAIEMAKVCPKVYVVSRGAWRGEPIMADRVLRLKNVEPLVGYVVQEIVGTDQVEAVIARPRAGGEGRRLEVKGAFIEIGAEPKTEFAGDLVRRNSIGEIIVNYCSETGTPGLYAAGDITMVCEKQIVVAAGEGAKAALKAFEYLLLVASAEEDAAGLKVAGEP